MYKPVAPVHPEVFAGPIKQRDWYLGTKQLGTGPMLRLGYSRPPASLGMARVGAAGVPRAVAAVTEKTATETPLGLADRAHGQRLLREGDRLMRDAMLAGRRPGPTSAAAGGIPAQVALVRAAQALYREAARIE